MLLPQSYPKLLPKLLKTVEGSMKSLNGCQDTCPHGRVGAWNTKQRNIRTNPLIGAAPYHKNEKLVQTLYSIKGCFPSKGIFHQSLLP